MPYPGFKGFLISFLNRLSAQIHCEGGPDYGTRRGMKLATFGEVLPMERALSSDATLPQSSPKQVMRGLEK
jgi:hypothetical protein